MGSRLFSAAYILFFILSAAVLFVIALLIWLVTAPFDRRLKALHRFSCFWGSLYIWTMPAWSVSTAGREHIRKDATYVVVSNHQSLVDILAAYRLFFHFKWVSKAEIFRIPIVGWNMRLNRYIRLHRGRADSVRKMMDAAERTLAEGSSVFIFPEGTRSETGEVKRFKAGAFLLAKKMQVPILPIVIDGSKNALPKKSLVVRGQHRITVRVLPAIPYASFADTPVEELAEQVRARIAGALAAAQ